MLKNRVLTLLFAGLLGLQMAFWSQVRDLRPEMEIVPPLPGLAAVRALSLGDEQFYFRWLGMGIQNAGDTFGRFTALKNYDYAKLKQWFFLLDTLDARSHYIPAMASYYYSQTQYSPDVRYVVDYLVAHAARDPARKWWWLVQAVYLAKHRLMDTDLALEVAQKLAAAEGEGIPIWARQMPAFIYEARGEFDAAYKIIEGITENFEEIPDSEKRFMEYFVRERLHKLEEEAPLPPATSSE